MLVPYFLLQTFTCKYDITFVETLQRVKFVRFVDFYDNWDVESRKTVSSEQSTVISDVYDKSCGKTNVNTKIMKLNSVISNFFVFDD